MKHEDALESKATERYLLEEMGTDERDAFEEHYFDCSECADDVRSGVQFTESLRRKTNVVDIGSHRRRSSWLPKAAAAAVIFGTLGWLGGANMQPPAQPPQITEMVQIDIAEAERGPGDAVVIPAGSYASLNFDIPDRPDAASYAYSLQDAAGKTLRTGTKSREDAAAGSVSLLLPALPRGSYRVLIEGVREDGNRLPISNIEFRVGER